MTASAFDGSRGYLPRMLELRAEMSATVLATPARPGDPVRASDAVIVLESMKMEIPVVAEVDGVVHSIDVVPGDVVQAGDLLAIVDVP